MTIATIIKAGITAGKTNDEILVDVYKDFPNANTKAASVSWYRSQMKVKAPAKTPMAKAVHRATPTPAEAVPKAIETAASDALKKISGMKELPTVYSVKSVKGTIGTEGHGYQLTLCRYGIPVCNVVDYAHGGPVDFHWIDSTQPRIVIHNLDYKGEPHSYKGTPEEKLFSDFVKAQPDYLCSWTEEDGSPIYMKMSTELYVDELLQEHDLLKHLKRLTSKKLAYVRKDGKIYTANKPYSVELAAKILEKNPGARILNAMSEVDAVKAIKVHNGM